MYRNPVISSLSFSHVTFTSSLCNRETCRTFDVTGQEALQKILMFTYLVRIWKISPRGNHFRTISENIDVFKDFVHRFQKYVFLIYGKTILLQYFEKFFFGYVPSAAMSLHKFHIFIIYALLQLLEKDSRYDTRRILHSFIQKYPYASNQSMQIPMYSGGRKMIP